MGFNSVLLIFCMSSYSLIVVVVISIKLTFNRFFLNKCVVIYSIKIKQMCNGLFFSQLFHNTTLHSNLECDSVQFLKRVV